MREELINPAGTIAAALISKEGANREGSLHDQISNAFITAYRALEAGRQQIEKDDRELAQARHNQAR